jgi:hypothetical protein
VFRHRLKPVLLMVAVGPCVVDEREGCGVWLVGGLDLSLTDGAGSLYTNSGFSGFIAALAERCVVDLTGC